MSGRGRQSRFLVLELNREFPGTTSLPPGTNALVSADSLEDVVPALEAKIGETSDDTTEHYRHG